MTPTHRYARDLSRRFRDNDTAVSLVSSQILSVDRWAETTWRQLSEQGLCEPKRLLNNYERQAVWRDIVASEVESRSAEFALIQPQVASQLAQRCREIMKTHRVPWSTQSLKSIFSVEFDTRIFHEWLSSCDRLLQQKGWIFPEDVYDIITETIDVKSGEVWLLNHPAPTPALKATIDGFFESSTWFELPKWGEPQPVEQFESKAQELKAAAVWALKTASDPESSCAIILSNYQEDRPELEYRLREAFNCLESEYTALPVTLVGEWNCPRSQFSVTCCYFCAYWRMTWRQMRIVALLRSPYLVGRQSPKSFEAIIDRLFAMQKDTAKHC